MVYGQIFERTAPDHELININVGGFKQKVDQGTLLRFPHTSNRYQERKVDKDWEQKSDESIDSSFEELSAFDKDLDKFNNMWCGKVRKNVWIIFENPGHSLMAKILAILSLSVVLTSIVAMCIHSMHEFQQFDEDGKEIVNPGLEGLEIACVVWFTVEFIARFTVTPCIKKFFKNPLNVIDFVSILPFYFTLGVESMDEDSEELENVGKVIQILRLMRIFRILKLARHSVGLRSLGATLRHSYHEVGLLLLFLTVGISIFSVLVYSVEKDETESGLHSIPMSWWWATISMTTVGYGDTYPVTLLGKLIGSICILCGILVVALPITIIFNKFSKYYRKHKMADIDRCNAELAEDCSNLPYMNIRDIYAKNMHSLIASISSMVSTNASDHSTIDASSIQDLETVQNTTICENCSAK
ncbi:potassium voltage-gated channel subfamily S member 3a isoform X3 [Scyliorhinus canicula]|uniref:potassium voltage-gated channel subfamily S member 3a isoform X3 n=1 Tax=Scyliorhinus canicula TaxID=7830 RepID=UPI0018F2B7C4|nr:potassium voltage-gated channel subfamily S member 3a isoform X3 [Scyliorhinus canicula]